MGILLGDMLVRYRADITDLTAKSAIASAEVEKSGVSAMSSGAMIGAGLFIASAAVIGLAAVSTKMAADYQQAMNKVQALTGASSSQMAQYDTGIKQLATDAGVAPKKLADGLYMVLSAGYQGKTAMDVLKLSVEDAKIGMTDQATTANALTTVLKAFSVPVKDITRVNGEMLETVTLGKMTMTDYAGSVGKASSTAMQFHVSMENMNASIATMTANGIPSAHQAVTDFNQGISVMYANIGTVTKSLEKNGIAFNEAKFNTLDYSGKIKMMAQALDEASSKHVKITGVTKQAAAEIQILNQHSSEFSKNLSTLSDKQAMSQKTAQAWAITQGGLNQSMDRLRAAGDVLFITIGQQLIPIFTKIVTAITPVVTAFTGWLVKSNLILPVLGAAAVIIGVGLVVAFTAMAAAAWAAAAPVLAMAAPFLLIGIAVVAVVAIIVLAIQHWSQITAWFANVWKTIWTAVSGFFVSVWNHIVDFAKTFGIYLIAAILGPAGIIIALIVTHWTQISGFLTNTWNKIVSFAKNFGSNLISTLQNFFGALPGMALQWGQNLIQGFINGIGNMIGNVKNAIGNVVNTVKNFLGFGSPTKEGPGTQVMTWGPNLVKSFASGIDSASPALKASINALVAPMNKYPIVPSAGGVGASTGASNTTSGQTFILEVDSVQLAKLLNTSTDRLVRLKLGSQGRAA